jgi:hypothetical protein
MNHLRITKKLAAFALSMALVIGFSQRAAAQTCPASDEVEVTVVPDISVTVDPVGFTICEGGTGSLTATITGGDPATRTFQWQSSGDGINFTNVAGATTVPYSVTSSTQGTTYWRLVVSSVNAGCGNATSGSATVIVTPPLSIAVQPQPVTVCLNGTATLSANVTGAGGSATYQWQSFVSGAWGNISGATSSSYSAPTTAVGTIRYRLIVSSPNNGCASITSDEATVTVDDVIAITSQPQVLDECIGGTASISVTATGAGSSATYQWQFLNTSGAWVNVASGGTSASYTPSSTTAGSTQYRVVISSGNNGCASQTSNPTTVTIFAKPTITVAVPPASICVDGTATLTATLNGGTGCTIIWQSNASGTMTDIVPAATGTTYTTPALTTSTRYKARVTCTGSGCCD